MKRTIRNVVERLFVGIIFIGQAHAVNAADTVELDTSINSHFQQQYVRGQLHARTFTILSAGQSGNIVSFSITDGDWVKKGRVIVRFDCRAKQAEKSVITAKLKAAKMKYEIYEKRSKLNNISQLELSQSEAEMHVMQAELEKMVAVLSSCEIKAPFSGVVIEKMVQAFQYVREGDALLQLVDNKRLEVEMVIPSIWLQKVKTKTSFTLQLDEVAITLQGKVDRIVGNIDPISQTVRVIGTISSPVKSLLPGMSGNVSFGINK